MRRLGQLVFVSGLLLAALLAAPAWPVARADQAGGATPVPSPAGVVFEPLDGGVVPPLVAEAAGVRLDRARFAPGAGFVVPAGDAAILLVAVEEGALTVRSSVPLVVDRAADPGTSGGTVHELIAAGDAVVLRVGDAFVRPPGSEQEVRNDGEEPALALAASVDRERAAGATEPEATPTSARGGAGLVVALAVVVVPECPEGYDPAEIHPAATPGGGGGGGVAMAIAAAPECVGR